MSRAPLSLLGSPEERLERALAAVMRAVVNPVDDLEGLHELLAIAGANVSLETVARWSPALRAEAIVWANTQCEAWATDTTLVIRWPAHVRLAHVPWS